MGLFGNDIRSLGTHAMKAQVIIGIACGMVGHISVAAAQSNVDPASKMSWSENCGYMNWFSAGTPAGALGVRVELAAGYAEGFIWAENVGWINLGRGGPYANTTGQNSGVNVNSLTGALTGFAWSENAGWINFSGGAMASPSNAARVDVAAGRLRGYAWGENVGWINLNAIPNGQHVKLVLCPADMNRDGGVDSDDVVVFFGFWDAGSVGADFNGDSGVDSDDVIDFFEQWDAGC